MSVKFPDPNRICHGRCEGTGVIPCQLDDPDKRLVMLWLQSHEPMDHTGFKFVICPDCHGSGER